MILENEALTKSRGVEDESVDRDSQTCDYINQSILELLEFSCLYVVGSYESASMCVTLRHSTSCSCSSRKKQVNKKPCVAEVTLASVLICMCGYCSGMNGNRSCVKYE